MSEMEVITYRGEAYVNVKDLTKFIRNTGEEFVQDKVEEASNPVVSLNFKGLADHLDKQLLPIDDSNQMVV